MWLCASVFAQKGELWSFARFLLFNVTILKLWERLWLKIPIIPCRGMWQTRSSDDRRHVLQPQTQALRFSSKQVKCFFSGMRSALKNVGRPFLCYTETGQITFPLQRTICYHIKRDFFFSPLLPLHHTSLSWRTSVFGTESSHCFRNVGGMVCLLRRGQKLRPEMSPGSARLLCFSGRKNGESSSL